MDYTFYVPETSHKSSLTYFWGPLHFSVVTLYSHLPSMPVIPVPFLQLLLIHHPRYSTSPWCSRPTPFPSAHWRPLQQYIWPSLLIHPSYMTIPLELSILNSVCVIMPTHCTITRFGFRARRIDGVECGIFPNHAPLGQTTLRVWDEYLYSVL